MKYLTSLGLMMVLLSVGPLMTNALFPGNSFNPEIMMRAAIEMRNKGGPDPNHCSDQIFKFINDPLYNITFTTLFISTGKSANDLGNFERCNSSPLLKYALVTLTGDYLRQRI